MKPILILLILIMLGGCRFVREVEVEINNTIYINRTINHTITINNTIPCNITEVDSCYNDKLELIRRINFLEKQVDEWVIDEEECLPHNATEEDLRDCKDDVDRYEDDIDDLEDDLEDCEDELCDINSTWC